MGGAITSDCIHDSRFHGGRIHYFIYASSTIDHRSGGDGGGWLWNGTDFAELDYV